MWLAVCCGSLSGVNRARPGYETVDEGLMSSHDGLTPSIIDDLCLGIDECKDIARMSTAVALPLLSAEERMPWDMRGWWSHTLRPATHPRPCFVRCDPPSLVCILYYCVLFAAALCALVDPKVMHWRLALVLVLLAAAMQDASGDASEVDSDAAPLLNASIVTSHVTRRLTVIHLQPGANLQTAVDSANPGDELVLGDGNYTGSGTAQSGDNMLYINKTITIRALNPGQVLLDGQNARRVIYIASGNVVLEGLGITGGSTSHVRAFRLTRLPCNGLSWSPPPWFVR